MNYVYILQSLQQSERYYVGITADLQSRLRSTIQNVFELHSCG